MEIQEQCQPGQDNLDKPIEHLLPATSTCYWESTSEDNILQDNSNPSSPRLANTVLVPTSNANASGASTPNKAAEVNPDPSPRCQERPSPLPQAPTDWLSCVRKSLQLQGITGETLNIIIDSWRESTQK